MESQGPANRYASSSALFGLLAITLAVGAIPWVPVYGGLLVLPSFSSACAGLYFAARQWPRGERHAALTRGACIVTNIFALLLAWFIATWFTMEA